MSELLAVLVVLGGAVAYLLLTAEDDRPRIRQIDRIARSAQDRIDAAAREVKESVARADRHTRR